MVREFFNIEGKIVGENTQNIGYISCHYHRKKDIDSLVNIEESMRRYFIKKVKAAAYHVYKKDKTSPLK